MPLMLGILVCSSLADVCIPSLIHMEHLLSSSHTAGHQSREISGRWGIEQVLCSCSFKIMFGMPSGPDAFDELISFSSLYTPSTVTVMEPMTGHGFFVHSGIGDPSSTVNTDLNWFIRSVAFDGVTD